MQNGKLEWRLRKFSTRARGACYTNRAVTTTKGLRTPQVKAVEAQMSPRPGLDDTWVTGQFDEPDSPPTDRLHTPVLRERGAALAEAIAREAGGS